MGNSAMESRAVPQSKKGMAILPRIMLLGQECPIFCNVDPARMLIHIINIHTLGTSFWILAYIISHPSLITCRSH